MRNNLLFSWLFLIPICSILLGLESDVVSGQCLSHQKSWLLQLKKNLIFNATESKKLVTWNQNSDCRTWEGVTFDGDGRVTGLSLSEESISGGIFDNSTLFNLQHLDTLDLSYNNFNSTIPARIGDLSTLSYLNVSNARFGGQIPKEISRLTSLVTLDISTSSLLYDSSLKLENPNLRMLVQNLSNLEGLYLDGVNISASGSEWCQALSSSVPKLQVLSLSDCDLSGPIDHSLEKLQSLSVIRLDGNSLFAPVPGFLANFSNLTALSLADCELNGTFPKEIFQVPTLQTIDISINLLLQGSLPEFYKNNALRRLVLSYTGFSGTLPYSMVKLTQLVYLDLSFNNFTGLIPSFKMSKNLTEIDLSQNSLTGVIASAHLEGLQKLVDVDLQNNLLSGVIPSSLFALPSLEKIQLSYNQFTGQLPELPNASFSILSFLALRSNKLEGSIPVSIFKLRKLSFLSLAFNKLNSTLQLDMFQGLHSLTYLDLSFNNLSFDASGDHSAWSSFPKVSTLNLASCKLITTFPNLKNQSMLVRLDLSDNQLHGQIPNWIWEIGNGSLSHLNLSHNYLVGIQEPYSLPSSLLTLDLHFNQICGKIPALPPSATYIDLSDNKFYSSIPTDFDSVFIIFLSLVNNSLTGIIPKSLCNATFLTVLDLSYNGLSGIIPPCLNEIDYLVVLNLRHNHFSSAIPDTFSVNSSLKTLDLSGNFIHGQVPKSLASCTELEVLDLGHNNMMDNFPCFLKSVSTLRVLSLRSNKFYGGIECNDTDETWKMLQIIDLAHNNFSGQIPARSLTNWKAMMAAAEIDNANPNLNHLQFEVLRFSQIYYQVSVTLTSKGLDSKLVKILPIYTYIDFSSNSFNGSIPEEIGALTLLYVLNLSNNAFSGSIPTSFGSLQHLESLDLSSNGLNGTIPTSLASLHFLSYLNLSFNQLIGRIPPGNQFQTFSENSFWGNEGLCGSPLLKNCTDGGVETPNDNRSRSETAINWDFLSAEIGFVAGFGIVVGPLLFSKRWRQTYFECLEDVAFWIFPLAVTRKWLSWTTGTL